METKVFAIRDTKAAVFCMHHTEPQEVDAVRALQTAVNQAGGKIHAYPDEFQLFHLATINDITGHVDVLEPPKFIVSAQSLIKKAGE